MPIPAGTHDNRFSLRFTNASLRVDDNVITKGIVAAYTSNDKMLNVENKLEGVEVQNVELYNILGQRIAKYAIADPTQTFIQLPVAPLATGTYIVRIQTNSGIMSEKIIIP